MLKQPAIQAVVEIIATQSAVATCGQYLEQALFQAQNGHVKRATTQVKHHKRAFRAVVQAVSDGGGGRLIEQTQNIQTCQTCGIFGGLALGIVEIGRHGNHRSRQAAAQAVFSAGF